MPAGLIFDESKHYLDHLGPFCALMGWPLIVCEDSMAELAKKYYPDLEVIEKDPFELAQPSHIVACDTRPLLQAAFPRWRFETIKTFWLPHGNSDKGWNTLFFEALEKEPYALVYGQKMIDFMKAKNVDPQMFLVGNFRYSYFQRHRAFYEKLLPALPRKTTFLYAPTWDDGEGSNSFWKAFPVLADSLPNTMNLLVKLHPNTRRQFEFELERLMGQYERKKNIFFLEEFPPIYPLLHLCDAYIGDMSSIGYDFLTLRKPMFFLNSNQRDQKTDKGLYLFRCGLEISPHQYRSLFQQYNGANPFSEIQKETCEYTFAPLPNWAEFKNRLLAL